MLQRIERHTVGIAARAESLRAAGRSLKRGLLLYGPPGVGKTLTVQYLASRMQGRTVLLTSGRVVGLVQHVVQLARSLAPSMVVLEDVDLIAEERGRRPWETEPLLFELLNAMDGLDGDADIIFLLTTNRPAVLEPALAARPGRIDLAVELPLPDAAARRRLLELYTHGLELEDVDLTTLAERIDGASPAYIKELLRRAALPTDSDQPRIVVTGAHLDAAIAELGDTGALSYRLFGFQAAQQSECGGSAGYPLAR